MSHLHLQPVLRTRSPHFFGRASTLLSTPTRPTRATLASPSVACGRAMSGAWGNRISLAQRLAAQLTPPPQSRVRQPDGSLSAPVILSLTDNLTVVLSLVLLSSDFSRIALLAATADSTSDRTTDGFHVPSELLLDGETVEYIASMLHVRLTGRPIDGSKVRVACVEHYPTLRQQWLRYTCIAVADTADEAAVVDGARWFPLNAVMDDRVKLASTGGLFRLLQSITQAQTHRRQNGIPTHSHTAWRTAAGSDCSIFQPPRRQCAVHKRSPRSAFVLSAPPAADHSLRQRRVAHFHRTPLHSRPARPVAKPSNHSRTAPPTSPAPPRC